MGMCNCKDSKYEHVSNVEVEKLGLKCRTNTSTKDVLEKQLVKIKSIRYANPDRFQSAKQVNEFLDKEDIIDPKTTQKEADIDDNMIIDHEIDSDEEVRIKKALCNHFLFKDMPEDLL
jgi:hypothetical protein